MPRLLIILIFVIVFVALPLTAMAQGGTSRYVYDDNGRLRAVVAPNGEANIYDYDAAGNFTGIRRVDANFLTLFTFYPKQGVAGDRVTIIGLGFGAGVNNVSFNGTSAQVVSFNQTTIAVTVPNGATTGPITVTTHNGSVTTTEPFTIKGVSINPTSATLGAGETLQFSATVFTTDPDTSVNWRVNGILGGNSTIGTITQSGFFTAPNVPFQSTVRATSNADPTLFADAQVTLQSFSGLRGLASSGVLINKELPIGSFVPLSSAISSGVLINKEVEQQTENTLGAISRGILINKETGEQPTESFGAISRGVLINRETGLPVQDTNFGAISSGVLINREPPDPVNPAYLVAPVSSGVAILKETDSMPQDNGLGAISSGVLVKKETNDVTVGDNALGANSRSVLVEKQTSGTNTSDNLGAISRGVLVNRETQTDPTSNTAQGISQGVLVMKGPVITSLSPTQATRDTTFTITINGINLNGVTSIRFMLGNGTVNTLIAATNISINTGGTVLTATVTIGGASTTGQHFVVLQTATTQSAAVNQAANVITIQ